MNRIKDSLKDKWFWLSGIISVIILCIAFGTKQIFPLGKNAFSMVDFDSGYVPVYYKLWDLLHGKGNIFIDWNLGSGLNVFGSLITNSIFFPSSLIIGIFKRSFIPYAMSFIMMLKFFKVALFTYFTFNYFFKKIDGKTKCGLTLLYTFSGWTIFNQSNILYLDVFGLFPLFVIAFYRLLKDGKWGWYLITLTICLISSYYMSYLILFFIIGNTIISLLILDIKDKKAKAIKVFLLTMLSLGLSCPLVLPSVYQSLTSARMSGNTVNEYNQFVFFLKLFHIYPIALSFVAFFKQIKVKKDKRINIYFSILVFYLLLGIVIEEINLLWHVGSYQGFPFRYAFIPSLILLLITGYYFNNNYQYIDKKTPNINITVSLLIIIFIINAILYCDDLTTLNYVYEIQNYAQALSMTSLLIISLLTCYYLFKINKKHFSIIMLIMVIISSLTYESLMMRTSSTQKSLAAQKIKDNLDLSDSKHNYVDEKGTMNINFPYILGVPSLQNRIHILDTDAFLMLKNLGIKTNNTLVYSTEGNLITNLLLQNKYYITSNELPTSLYTLKDQYADTNLYESKYNLDVILYDGKLYNKENDIITNTNNIAKNVFKYNQDILLEQEISNNTIELLPNKIYYMNGIIENTKEDDDRIILKKFDNAIMIFAKVIYNKVEMQFYVEEETNIDLEDYDYKDIKLNYINVDSFLELYNSLENPKTDIIINRNAITYSFINNDHTHVLIPKFYDQGFKAFVNGKEVPIEKNIYDLMSIKIDKGENEVKLVFVPKMFKEGIIIAMICCIILIITTFLNKYIHFLDKKLIIYPLFVIVAIIGAFFIIKVYILSWILK